MKHRRRRFLRMSMRLESEMAEEDILADQQRALTVSMHNLGLNSPSKKVL